MRLFSRDKNPASEPQFNDEELRQGFSIKLEDGALIHIDYLRQLQNQTAQIRLGELIVEDVLAMFRAHPERQFLLLLDIRNVQQGAFFYLPAAQPYRRLAEHPQFSKAAAITTGALLAPLIEMFVRSMKKESHVRVFHREADARRWLHSQDAFMR